MAIHTDESARQKKAQKLQNEAARLEQNEIEAAIKLLFSRKEGRTFLWHLMKLTKAIGHVPYFGEETHKTAFACGELNIGVMLLRNLITVDPVGFTEMQKEKTYDRTNPSNPLRNPRQPEFNFGRSDPSSSGNASEDTGNSGGTYT